MLSHLPTVVMWNPSAGSADESDAIRQQLQSMPEVTICEPGGRDQAIEETIRRARDGAELIVAAGGDGTVSSIVEGIVQSEQTPVLGVLPLGTGNDLARALEVPLALEAALHVLVNGRVVEMDAVQCTSLDGSRWYANMLTGGNTGRYLQHMTDEVKKSWGPLCYLRGVIDVIRDLQVYEIEVTCDDGPPESFSALNVFVANGRFSGGGLDVSPEAALDDGLVDLVIVRDGEAGEIASLTSTYVVADYLQHELVVFRQARHIRLVSTPPLPLTADGDEVGETPLSVEVHPRCLRVLVPQDESTARA